MSGNVTKLSVNYAGLMERGIQGVVPVKSKSEVFTLGRHIANDRCVMPVSNSLMI